MTIAPTPIATQMKKNSRRRHDARSLARRHLEDEGHADDPAVAQVNRDVGDGGQLGVVGDEHERRAARPIDPEQEVDDVPPGRAVEVPRRLVRQQQRRIVRQRPRDGDPLLLTAGELRRIVVPPAREADFLQQRARPRRRARHPGDLHRHQDVLERRQRREQVEELEDEPDPLAAQRRERVLPQPGDIGAADQDPPGGRGVETGDQAEQR